MTKIEEFRVDLLDEENRYRVFGFNNMLITNDIDAVLGFLEVQILGAEVMNGMLPPVGKDDNTET